MQGEITGVLIKFRFSSVADVFPGCRLVTLRARCLETGVRGSGKYWDDASFRPTSEAVKQTTKFHVPRSILSKGDALLCVNGQFVVDNCLCFVDIVTEFR